MRSSVKNVTTIKEELKSKEDDAYLTAKEAARILRLSPQTIWSYVKNQLLPVYILPYGKKRISRNALYEFMELRERNQLTMVHVFKLASTALLRVASLEEKVKQLEDLAGIDTVHLDTSQIAVANFYEECVELFTDYTADMRPAYVLDWAYRLAAVNEEYLEAVRVYMRTEEPWTIFMEAAQKMSDAAPRERFAARKDLEVAYGYLDAARIHLRQVCYFYIHNNHGKQKANRAFPDMQLDERDDKILRMVFLMHPQKRR